MPRRGRGVRFTASAAAIVLAAVVTGACTDDGPGAPAATSAPAPTTTVPSGTATSTTTRATSSTTSTAPTASTTLAPTSTTRPPSTTGAAPPAVTDLRAGPGGGSGEVSVVWRGVPGAVRYRVERGPAATGPFDVAGVLDVATGTATRSPGVTNLYAAGDGSFVLVEVVTGLTNSGASRWYRVVAEGQGSASAPSRAVCGAPPGAPAC